MPKLILQTNTIVFIVQQLALNKTPQTVANLVKETFGIEITRQCVNRYNPAANERLHARWVDLFNHTRAKWKNALSQIPIAHKSYRLRQLNNLLDRARRLENPKEIRATLEQAAKEMGGAYSK